MYSKKVRYTDFLGNVREETFRFNLTETEMLELNLKTEGGLQVVFDRWSERQDVPSLVDFWNNFIKMAYGVVSDDGRKFIKNDEVWEDFYYTNAYNVLYQELLTNDEAAFEFIQGAMKEALSKTQGNDQNVIAIEKAKAAAEARIKNNE